MTDFALRGIQPELSVRNGREALRFYAEAFGAVVLFRFGGTDENADIVAQLAVGDAVFWIEDESPAHGNYSPQTVGGATTRILLICNEPALVAARAVAAGAVLVSPVAEEHGWLLGRVDDPYGHRWEIGRPLVDWPPSAQ